MQLDKDHKLESVYVLKIAYNRHPLRCFRNICGTELVVYQHDEIGPLPRESIAHMRCQNE